MSDAAQPVLENMSQLKDWMVAGCKPAKIGVSARSTKNSVIANQIFHRCLMTGRTALKPC